MEAELEEIKEKIALYKDRKLSWLEFAPYLEQKRKEGKDYKLFESLGLSEKIYSTMTRAYRFLSVRRLLDHDIKAGVETIGLLPATYRRLKGKITEEEFEQLVLDALAGKIGTKKLSRMGRGVIEKKSTALSEETVVRSFELYHTIRLMAMKKFDPRVIQHKLMAVYDEVDEEPHIEAAFAHALEILDILLPEVLKSPGRKILEEKYGAFCHDLAISLECIADEHFHDARNERSSFKI